MAWYKVIYKHQSLGNTDPKKIHLYSQKISLVPQTFQIPREGNGKGWWVVPSSSPPSTPSLTPSTSFQLLFLKNIYLFIWLPWLLVAARGLSCPVACGILVPWPGIEPTSPALEGRFLTTGPPGKSHNCYFNIENSASTVFSNPTDRKSHFLYITEFHTNKTIKRFRYSMEFYLKKKRKKRAFFLYMFLLNPRYRCPRIWGNCS